MLNKNRKRVPNSYCDASAFDFLHPGKNSTGRNYLSSLCMHEGEKCTWTVGLALPFAYNTCIIIYTSAGSKHDIHNFLLIMILQTQNVIDFIIISLNEIDNLFAL